MKKWTAWLVFLASAAAVISGGCGGAAPGPGDMIPKSDLPSDMVFSASSEETIRDNPPSRLGHTPPPVVSENVRSQSLAKYRYGTSGDAYYVLVVKCKDEEAAAKVLETYLSVTFSEEEDKITEVTINGHQALKGYVASTSDYVYFWSNKEFVFGVVGSSQETALGLAEATG